MLHNSLLADKKVLLTHAIGRRLLHSYPDVGLGYLATSLIKNGVRKENIKILCKDSAKWKPDKFKDFLRKENFDIIGIKTFSGTLKETNSTLKIIKEVLPDALRVVGGPHPSSVLEKTFNDIPDAHYAFRGECEYVFIDFLRVYFARDIQKYSEIEGLIWRDNGQVRVNKLPIIEELDSLGFPCWELLSPHKALINPWNGVAKHVPGVPIILSRGCNSRCTFCSAHLLNGYEIRYRSINLVLDELEFLVNNYGIKEFYILDSNAAASKDRFAAFCQGLIDKGFQLTWSCPNGIRLNTIDEKLAQLMRQSGCYSIYVGIESGSPKILKRIKKGINLHKLKEQIQMINKQGIKVFGYFIIGFPDETREDIEMTIKYAKDLPILGGSFAILTPFPGTQLYEDLLSQGRIHETDFEKMDCMNYKNNFSELSSEELVYIRRKMFFALYLRSRTLVYFLSLMKSPYNYVYQFKKVLQQYWGLK